MQKTISLQVSPDIAYDLERLQTHIASIEKLEGKAIHIRIIRRSIDARRKKIVINLKVLLYIEEKPPLDLPMVHSIQYQDVVQRPQAIIVGAGPAGLFAALRLIELGIKPIVLERGKDVQSRRRDLANINKHNIVHPDSNYCFGEGGAGTYSDGKLYTRSKKRGSILRILEILVRHGASQDILIDAHPHIGTNKLPKIIANIREQILLSGGEIHFNTKMVDIDIQQEQLRAVVAVKDGKEYVFEGKGVILATGHSARDVYHLLHQKKVLIEAKAFALGVRVEHAQHQIDCIQYHNKQGRGDFLPAASYSLVSQVTHDQVKKGVFSFCMCPGGFIVPAATSPGEIVVNGMSPSRRDSQYANSGIVVEINAQDWAIFDEYGPLAALKYQQAIEQKAWQLAGMTQAAPAQLLKDFVHQDLSKELLPTSYQPGLVSTNLWEVLPLPIVHILAKGFKAFDQKMNGYLTNEAQVVGVESRSSAPVRIPRDKDTLEHLTLKRLFPCGEGAGYAGGIVSAALDGERCASQLYEMYR